MAALLHLASRCTHGVSTLLNEPLACMAVAQAARVPPRHAGRGVTTAMQEYSRLQALCTCKSTVCIHTLPLLHLASRCTHGVSTLANEPLACKAAAQAARVPPWHARRGVTTAMQGYSRLQALCTCKSRVCKHTLPSLHLASRCTRGVSKLANKPLACTAAAQAARVPPWHARRWATTA